MAIKLDFSGIKGVPPPGMYVLRLVDAKFTPKKNEAGDDTSYIACRYEVMEPEEWVGCPPIFVNHSLTPQSKFFLKTWLEALTQQDWSDDDMDLEPKDLVNLFVNAILDVGEWKGQERSEVKAWFPHIPF